MIAETLPTTTRKILTFRKDFLLALLLLVSVFSYGQNITKFEYFVDTDPSIGLATTVNVTPGIIFTDFNIPVSTSALSPGFHTLYIRSQNELGIWTHTHYRTFFIDNTILPPTISSFNPSSGLVGSTVVITGTNFSTVPANNTVRFNGTPATVTASTSTSITVTVPIGATTGLISVVVGGLTANSGTSFTVTSPNLIAAEYFFNTDPGPGNGTPISITAGTTIDISDLNIPTASLPIGWHLLCVRAKDANNVWGFYECRRIYVRETPPIIPVPPIEPITAIEFFYNTDNGPGTGTAIPAASGNTVDLTNINFASTLPTGWHTVSVRAKNNANVWGFYESRKIYVRELPPPPPPGPSPIVAFEFFVDTDPGVGQSTLNFTQAPASLVDLVDYPLNIGTVAMGAHKIGLRAKNQNGDWSMTETRDFTITTPCTIITPPTASNATRCTPGTLTLTASGASGGQTYRWYADNATLTSLFQGNPFITPSLAVNTNYFVSVYDPVTFCESPRTQVTAIVTGIAKPVLNLTGSLAVCAGSSVTLTAPAGYTSYTWSNGLTTPSITLTASGVYSVIVGDGTCSSPSSDAFTFTVNPLPLTPTITATNGGSLCGTGSVTLSAPAGFTSYSWSSGQTTQNITVSSVGNFTVHVTNASGCQSPPSDAFSVTTTPPAKPTVSITGNTNLCGGSTVTLSAPAGFSSYNWSNGSTSQNIIVNTAGSYIVTVANGACISPVSDAVVVTNVSIPPKPTITVTGNTALCIGSFAVLTATASPVYLWSTGETTQQIVVSTAGAYTVQVGNTTNCLSVASNTTTISLTGIVCPGAVPTPTITSGSTCGTGSVTLSATGATGSQVYRWYDVPSGGSVLFTGANFSTPIISTTTNYYAAIFDPTVPGEGSRSMGTASIVSFATPSISPSGTVTICAGSSTLLSAPSGFTNYLWSNGATSQQISVSAAGNYSVQTGSSTCLSAASATVILNVSPALAKPTVTVTGSTTLCGGSTVQLAAPAGFSSYAWSNGATTQTITVSAAGSLTVSVSNGICTSPTSDLINVNSIAVPTKPTISITGSTALCNGAFAVLSAPNGFNNYFWSTGDTTPQIVVNASGSFTVQVGNASNCLSVASDIVTTTLTGLPCGTTNVPSPPSVTNATRCGPGTVTLIASGASTGQVYRWYADATSSTVLFTGSNFSTSLSSNSNFYVSIHDPSVPSESNRALATATIINIANPSISGPSTIAICQGGSALLSAPTGFLQYIWSPGNATTQELNVTTSGSYSVQVGDGTCLSASSAPVVVSVSPLLSKPVITPSGVTALCGSGSVQLSTPVASGLGYQWSTGATGNSITVTAAGSYSVRTSNGVCTSPDADPVVVNIINIPSAPTITPPISTSFCKDGIVVLSASVTFPFYQWSKDGTLISGATGRQLSAFETGSYSLQVGNTSTCLSPSSIAIQLTNTGQPCTAAPLPVIPIASNTSRCGAGLIDLVASGALPGHQYRWYNASGTLLASTATFSPSVSLTSDFFASTFDPIANLESNRIRVIVTIYQTPARPVISAQGREFLCGGSVVALSAPTGFVVYRWSTGVIDNDKQSILVDKAGKFSVQVGMSASCLSEISTDYEVKSGTPSQCGVVVTPASKAPVILSKTFGVQIQSTELYPLKDIVIDVNDNQDLNTLRVLEQPNSNGKQSGGKVSIDADFNLFIDYRGVSFTGKENITLQVCDVEGLCTQQQLVIDVVGDVVVFNGLSPNGDGFNDFMKIQFIDVLEGAKQNKVVILNRWGDVVFKY